LSSDGATCLLDWWASKDNDKWYGWYGGHMSVSRIVDMNGIKFATAIMRSAMGSDGDMAQPAEVITALTKAGYQFVRNSKVGDYEYRELAAGSYYIARPYPDGVAVVPNTQSYRQAQAAVVAQLLERFVSQAQVAEWLAGDANLERIEVAPLNDSEFATA